MCERIQKLVTACEYDNSRDVGLFAFTDGMAIYASGENVRRVTREWQRARSFVGMCATFELENGRWWLKRLEGPAECGPVNVDGDGRETV